MFEPPERQKEPKVDKRERKRVSVSDKKRTATASASAIATRKKVRNKLIESKPTSVTSVYWI